MIDPMILYDKYTTDQIMVPYMKTAPRINRELLNMLVFLINYLCSQT